MGLGRPLEAPNIFIRCEADDAADSMMARSTFRDEPMVNLIRSQARDVFPCMLGV